ncbi:MULTISPECIES: YybH family protein [unclassified Variovorax]|uniref:YybH family protein n=1 Tax=unclassified Variovorax TaxID=663243 RepID=UPI003F45D5EF
MNETFGALFNARDLEGLLSLYEPQAMHQNTVTGEADDGILAIERSLRELLKIQGTMESVNNFTLAASGLALLRADWRILDNNNGTVLAEGSSAEVLRQQADGSWLYLIDHAVGSSMPRVDQ